MIDKIKDMFLELKSFELSEKETVKGLFGNSKRFGGV